VPRLSSCAKQLKDTSFLHFHSYILHDIEEFISRVTNHWILIHAARVHLCLVRSANEPAASHRSATYVNPTIMMTGRQPLLTLRSQHGAPEKSVTWDTTTNSRLPFYLSRMKLLTCFSHGHMTTPCQVLDGAQTINDGKVAALVDSQFDMARDSATCRGLVRVSNRCQCRCHRSLSVGDMSGCP
jgi:hypothetical protein